MTYNSNLESLNIAQSPLQDNAGQNNIIVQQLQMHPCLTEINLSSCNISNAEAFVLAIHPSLLSLTLINHNIGFLGAIALALSKNLIKLKIPYQHNLGWLFLWGNQTLKSLIWRINKAWTQQLFFEYKSMDYLDYINLNALGGRNAQLKIQLYKEFIEPFISKILPRDISNIIDNYNEGGFKYPYDYSLFSNSLTPKIREKINQQLPKIREEFSTLEEKYKSLGLL